MKTWQLAILVGFALSVSWWLVDRTNQLAEERRCHFEQGFVQEELVCPTWEISYSVRTPTDAEWEQIRGTPTPISGERY